MDEKDDIQFDIDEVSQEGSDIAESEIEEIEGKVDDKLKSLKTKLKKSEEERVKLLEDLQRTKADFLNSKRRLEEQSLRNNERVTERILIDLLPLLDSFETALGDTEALERLDPNWKTGIQGIYSLFTNFLRTNGIVEIESEGKHFSPHEHEAISNIPVTDAAQIDKVISVLQKGYKRNDVVLRPAKVTVGVEKH